MLILGTALIIDNNNEIKSLIWENLYRDYPDNFIFQQSTTSSFQLVKDKKKNISIILISADLPKLNLEDFVAKLLEETAGSVPIILTHRKAVDPGVQTKLVSMGITGVEAIPKHYQEVKTLLRKYLSGKQEFNDVEASAEEKGKDISTQDALMIQIPLDKFVFTPKSFFNVFIKLAQDKYIKILNAGDPINQEFIEKYKAKNISGLYLKSEEHSKYLKLSNVYSQKIASDSKRDDATKVNVLSNEIEAVTLNLTQLGVSPENVALAKGCVENSRNMINQMLANSKKGKTLELIGKIMGHDHSTSVSMLAGIFARAMDIRSPKTVQVIGLAALVHDIGLGTNIRESNKDKFTPEENIKYMKHAAAGADYLRKSEIFEEVICQIVENHHEQENQNSKKAAGALSIASEVIAISDSIATHVFENSNPSKAINQFRISRLRNFSIAIQKAFDEIFPQDQTQKR